MIPSCLPVCSPLGLKKSRPNSKSRSLRLSFRERNGIHQRLFQESLWKSSLVSWITHRVMSTWQCCSSTTNNKLSFARALSPPLSTDDDTLVVPHDDEPSHYTNNVMQHHAPSSSRAPTTTTLSTTASIRTNKQLSHRPSRKNDKLLKETTRQMKRLMNKSSGGQGPAATRLLQDLRDAECPIDACCYNTAQYVNDCLDHMKELLQQQWRDCRETGGTSDAPNARIYTTVMTALGHAAAAASSSCHCHANHDYPEQCEDMLRFLQRQYRETGLEEWKRTFTLDRVRMCVVFFWIPSRLPRVVCFFLTALCPHI